MDKPDLTTKEIWDKMTFLDFQDIKRLKDNYKFPKNYNKNNNEHNNNNNNNNNML